MQGNGPSGKRGGSPRGGGGSHGRVLTPGSAAGTRINKLLTRIITLASNHVNTKRRQHQHATSVNIKRNRLKWSPEGLYHHVGWISLSLSFYLTPFCFFNSVCLSRNFFLYLYIYAYQDRWFIDVRFCYGTRGCLGIVFTFLHNLLMRLYSYAN